jgi:hypothetical protein
MHSTHHALYSPRTLLTRCGRGYRCLLNACVRRRPRPWKGCKRYWLRGQADADLPQDCGDGTVLSMHCTHYVLYSLCTVLTMHCTPALYSLCTVLTMHCTHHALYSSTVLTMHSTPALYSPCTVLTMHCTHHALYSPCTLTSTGRPCRSKAVDRDGMGRGHCYGRREDVHAHAQKGLLLGQGKWAPSAASVSGLEVKPVQTVVH